VGASPPPLSNAGRTIIQRTHLPTRSKAANPLRSIAALQNLADFARGFPNLAPASWSAVVGARPPPLANAGRTIIQRTTSPPARKRRIRAAPSPHSNTSPPSHGASRSSRQRFGVRLWAKPSTAFLCRTDSHPAHHLPTRSKAANPRRSIAALQYVAAFPRGFPNLAPASWSAVVGEALHRFRLPDGRSSSALPPHPPEKR
jgi:hypothetical protein